MRGFDTSIGGAQGRFPNTTWGLIARFADPSVGDRREDLEALCRRYWKPVYRYVRIAWAKSNEDAKDLTQAFFAWLFEKETLARYLPERGSFRAFLKVLLSRFVSRQEEALHTLKRGGAVRILTLDDADAAIGEVEADRGTTDPWKRFDRAWGISVMQHAIESLRERLVSEGREMVMKAFEAYDLVPEAERPTYPD